MAGELLKMGLGPTEIHEPSEDWSNPFALDVVMRDFNSAERYLQQNHYSRWNEADKIYLAWTQQKVWEGTKVPRATPAVWLAFEHIESLMPIFMSAIFGNEPLADAIPMPGTSPEEARIGRDYIISQFDDAKGIEQCRRALKSGLIYGNGICEAGWESFTRKETTFVTNWTQQTKTLEFPMVGKQVIPTGKYYRTVKERQVEREVNRPFLKYISLRDFYIDPNCQSPNIQDARYVIKRCYMTIDELAALRDTDGFDIPGDEELRRLASRKYQSQGDSSKTVSAAYNGESYQPQLDQTADPAGKMVEVWNYWTMDRCVWILGREHVAWNDENYYRDHLGDKIIPFFNAFYTDVSDRFYCLGVTDVVEWDQRVIVSLLGGRLDELALNLNPPRLKRRGQQVPAYQMRRRPGAVAEFDDPNQDIVVEQVSNVTQQAFIEVQAAEIRAQKVDGVTDNAVLGVASSGGNAAARTATGVQVQASASGRRHIYLVENIEAGFVEPILNFFAGMNNLFLDPGQMIEFTGRDGKQQSVDALQVKRTRAKFKMRSGTRARARAALQQMMPLMLQTLLNPEWLQMLAQQQKKTVDIEELGNMLADSADYSPRGSLFRPLTQEELQAMQPKPPQPDPTKLMMQRERLMAQMKMQHDKLRAASDNQDSQHQADLLMQAMEHMGNMQEEKASDKAES